MKKSKLFLALATVVLVILCCSAAGCFQSTVPLSDTGKQSTATVVPTATPTSQSVQHDPVYATWYFIDKDGSEIDIYMNDADMTGTIYTGDSKSMFYDKQYHFSWVFDKAVGNIRYYSLEIEGMASATVKYNSNTDTIDFFLKKSPNELITLLRIT